MRRNIFLTIMVSVALMSSCSGDMYDNIKELVDSETVYPAGYDQQNVTLKSGLERVEIYLCEPGVTDSNVYLPKAIKTVVEFGEVKREFKPARSWVNVDNLTIPQVYHFKIYTEDEYGNISPPVEISGKPFTEADKAQLVISGVMTSANTSQAVINPTPAPNSYAIIGGTYSFPIGGVVRSGTFTGARILLEDLQAGQTYNVNFTFDLLPVGAIDTIPVAYDVNVKTMSQTELDDYINLSSPFPATADGKLGNPYYVTSSTPFVISAAAFDLGGSNKGHYIVTYDGGEIAYRQDGGDTPISYGVDYSAAPLVAMAWAAVGEWYAYTVNVQDPGLYKLEYNSASAQNGCQATLTLDNLDVLGIIPIANNGNWGNYQWFDPNVSIRLSAGKHKFRWTQRSANYNFGGLRLTFVE